MSYTTIDEFFINILRKVQRRNSEEKLVNVNRAIDKNDFNYVQQVLQEIYTRQKLDLE